MPSDRFGFNGLTHEQKRSIAVALTAASITGKKHDPETAVERLREFYDALEKAAAKDGGG
jgi:hypothetical protein